MTALALFDSFSVEQVEAFDGDGFLVVEAGLVSEGALEKLRDRYLRLFEGEYETGIRPAEVNWVPGRDPEDRTRQLCNAWKSDNVVAAQVLSQRTGCLAANSADTAAFASFRTTSSGSRPERRRSASQADAGPLEFVRGSHAWPKSPPSRTKFHAPEDWLAGARAAALTGAEPETVPVVVKPGGGSFHHGLTWHGSAPNRSGSVARMALVSHLIPVEARFHETNVDLTYSRYRRRGDLSLDESFFPVLWDESGYRTPWLSELPTL